MNCLTTETRARAMQAGLSDHAWSIEELVALIPKPTVRASTLDRELILKALGTKEELRIE